MNILNVDATFGGATHDSFIFNQHPIKSHLLDLFNRGETGYLLGKMNKFTNNIYGIKILDIALKPIYILKVIPVMPKEFI